MVIAEAMLADLPAVPSSASLVEAARLLRKTGSTLLPVRSGMTAIVVRNNDGQIVGVATLAQVLDGLNRPPPEGPM